MKAVIITGSGGLIGSEATRFFAKKGFEIVGIDNDMRSKFFGEEASTKWNVDKLKSEIDGYNHYSIDIRDVINLENVFKKYRDDTTLVIHTAAQPSHDWAASNPFVDWDVNSRGTLNVLEMTRRYCKDAVFIHCSTNKVYGDTPNSIPLVELDTRYEPPLDHPYYQNGIPETMSIDQSKHSLFGVSKLAADILVQEYRYYFGMNTTCFRGGCLTGQNHSGSLMHGFLSYLVKCFVHKIPYTIFGYRGKQVRDNIHAYDLIKSFWEVYKNPHKSSGIYNIGGGRYSNCSVLEAITICEEITGEKMEYKYTDVNRIGDHKWWISDVTRFKIDYPKWKYRYGLKDIIEQIILVENEKR